MSDKPTIEDVKAQLNQTEAPKLEGSKAIIQHAIETAESGDTKALLEPMVIDALKEVRGLDEGQYVRYKAEIKPLLAKNNIATIRDLDKLTKPPRKPRAEGEAGRESKADLLIALVRKNSELFHDEDNECYASYKVDHAPDDNGQPTGEHYETTNLRSKAFKQWANFQFYETYGSTAGDSPMTEAIDTLSGISLYEGEEQTANLRYATHEDKIYIDLGREHWEIVVIDQHGYKVIESKDAPVKFIRSSLFRPLPLPQEGGSVGLLWDHLNLQDEDSRLLVLAWLIECMRIDRPFPLMEISSGQGTAKSTFSKRLRVLIDPNRVNLRAAVRNTEDIFIATQSNHIICYENLSHLSANQQDAFSILATGGGMATRKLYSTTEEEAFNSMSPVLINGISELVTRADLADRTISISLSKITKYITESDLEKAWDADYPKITGALYSLLSETLAELPAVQIDKPPRMADFARLGQAMLNTNILGVDESFSEIFQRNRDTVITRSIEASPVALAVIDLLNGSYSTGKFTGTMKDLLNELSNHKPKFYDSNAWPKSPRALGDIIKRLAPALRVRGIDAVKEDKPKRDGYHITISKIKPVQRTKTDIEL